MNAGAFIADEPSALPVKDSLFRNSVEFILRSYLTISKGKIWVEICLVAVSVTTICST
jgi:hypothetical protein